MAYAKKTYEAASAALARRKERAETEAAARRDEAFARAPRLAEIERELRGTCFELVQCALSGGGSVDRVRERNLALQAEQAETLVTLGYPPDYLEPHYACPRCRDTGRVDGLPCACYERELKKQAFLGTNLGGALQGQSFDNFDLRYYPEDEVGGVSIRARMEQNLNTCRAFAEDFDCARQNLLLLGATGLGKTHLSSAIAQTVAESGHSVVYDTAGEIFQRLDDRRFGRDTDGGAAADSYFSCELLIIDDLGSEMTTALTVAHLFSILNDRMNRGRRMVISTNLTPEGICKRYDEKISSRIIGEFLPLPFAGRDIRQQRRMQG